MLTSIDGAHHLTGFVWSSDEGLRHNCSCGLLSTSPGVFSVTVQCHSLFLSRQYILHQLICQQLFICYRDMFSAVSIHVNKTCNHVPSFHYCVIPECHILKSIHRGLPCHVSSSCCRKGTRLCHTLLECKGKKGMTLIRQST